MSEPEINDLSIVVPLFNEEDNVQELISRLDAECKRLLLRYEIILVDDGSSDETASRAAATAAFALGKVTIISHTTNRGIVPAWKSGLSAANSEFACLIDGDLQNRPESIGTLWREMTRQVTSTSRCLIQAVRISTESRYSWRNIQSRVFNRCLNRAFRDTARDHKSGFMLGRRIDLLEILPEVQWATFPQSFIRAKGKSLGFDFVEVDCPFDRRKAGTSFLLESSSFGNVLRAAIDVVKAVPHYREGRFLLKGAEAVNIETLQPDLRPSDPRASLKARLTEWVYLNSLESHSWVITRRDTVGALSFLRESQYLNQDDIRSFQEQRLETLIDHARRYVKFYGSLERSHGAGPDSLWPALAGVPLLDKDVLRGPSRDLLLAEKVSASALHEIRTSGSTGEPLITFADSYQLSFRFASTLRSLEWTGWSFGDPQVRLWHQKIGMTKSQAFRERLDARLLNRTFIPAFEFDERALQECVSHLNRRKPILIDGYAESFNLLSRFVQTNGTLEISPKAVVSSAQTLTHETRRLIEDSMKTKVFDKYGAREFSGIAYQCGHSPNYHVMDESYLVEIIKGGRPARPGEIGEVVVTDLNNYSFPLVRYRIGDLALAVEQDACACGRGLSQIGEIRGRTQALIHCENGRWLPGTFFAHLFKDLESTIRSFQVVQEEEGSFEVRVVPNGVWGGMAEEAVLLALEPYVGKTIVRVVPVSEIRLSETGKRTPVISKVRVDFQDVTSV